MYRSQHPTATNKRQKITWPPSKLTFSKACLIWLTSPQLRDVKRGMTGCHVLMQLRSCKWTDELFFLISCDISYITNHISYFHIFSIYELQTTACKPTTISWPTNSNLVCGFFSHDQRPKNNRPPVRRREKSHQGPLHRPLGAVVRHSLWSSNGHPKNCNETCWNMLKHVETCWNNTYCNCIPI